MMALQAPNQTIWYKPSTWAIDWRKFVPFWKEDPPVLTSLTGKRLKINTLHWIIIPTR